MYHFHDTKLTLLALPAVQSWCEHIGRRHLAPYSVPTNPRGPRRDTVATATEGTQGQPARQSDGGHHYRHLDAVH